jgi:phage gp29-like protein
MANAVAKTKSALSNAQVPALRKPPASVSFAISPKLTRPAYSPDDIGQMFGRIADPDDTLRAAGKSRGELRKMLGEEEISQAMETRRDALLGTPWRLEPYGSRATKFVWEVIEPHVNAMLGGAFGATPFGYSVIDPIYEDLGARGAGLSQVIDLPFERYIPQRDGTLKFAQGFGVLSNATPEDKLILTRRNPTWLNPYGEALLSRLYWPWFFKTRGVDYWMQWLERWAQPFMVGETSGEINPETRRKFTEELADYLVTAMRGGVIALDPSSSVRFEHGEASNGDQFKSLVMLLNASIQKVILGQTLTSEMPASGGGSRAAAQVHDLVRQDKRNADIRTCHNAVQKIINTLWALNRFSGTAPTFVQADNTGLEEARATRDKTLKDGGIVKAFTRKYIVSRYDYEDDDIVMEEDAPAAPAAQPATAPTNAAIIPIRASIEFANTSPQAALTDDQIALDNTLAKTVEIADAQFDRTLVFSAIRAASDQKDLRKRLSILFHGADQSALEILAARATNAAELMGYANHG